MSATTSKPSLGKLGGLRPRSVKVTSEEWVRESSLIPDNPLPLVLLPAREGVDLVGWAKGRRDFLDDKLRQHGGILFRGFDVGDVARFEELIRAVSGEALEYRERSSPRHSVGGNIYTSTDYPPDQPIFLHNENSYAHRWPLKIFFFCHTPPETGGATPIADVHKVFMRLPETLCEKFKERGILYVRNFSEVAGLPWRTVFQTHDKAEVERYCRDAGYETEWSDEQLRTRRRGHAIYRHPSTDEPVWFNHATFFHVSTLAPRLRDGLLAQFGEENLPNNTYYGDGSEIEPEVLDQLRDAYESEIVRFAWQKGDVLMLDNMKVAHARDPFTGPRRILAGMAQPVDAAALTQARV